MAFEVGDRVYAEKSGRRRRTARQPMRPGRHGVVVRVLRGDPNPRYEIKWDEGITTVFSPERRARCTPTTTTSRPRAPRRAEPHAAARSLRRPPNASRTAASAGLAFPVKS